MLPLGKLSFREADSSWQFETTPDVIIRLKRIFPRASQTRVNILRLKHTAEIADEIEWVLQRFPMEVSDPKKLRSAAKRHRKAMEYGEQLMLAPASSHSFPLAIPLRDYQAQGTSLYLSQQFLLLADHLGLGKTATAIGSFTDPRTLPALVVVQAHLPTQWKEEIEKFINGIRVHIIKQCDHYELPEAEVYIISYSKLHAWTEKLAPRIRSLVFDEVQELRCTDTKKYRAAVMLRDQVQFRMGLSATPVVNYGGEIWSIFNILQPDALGSLDEFTREWCNSINGKLIVRDPDALGHYLRNKRLMLRRSRKDVGRELPPLTRFIQDVDFDSGAYKDAIGPADELAKLILSGSFLERGQATREFDTMVRQATGVAKAPFVAELVRMLLESGEKVLLGGWHHAVYDIWKVRLKDFNPVFFTGQQSPGQKQQAKADFISGKSNLMVMSLRSGAGTNGLQDVCSVAVLGELDWSPKIQDQFIGRIDRDGQVNSCQVFIPVASEGSDPTVATILGLKGAQSSGIVNVGSDEDADEIEVSPDRVKQLARDFLARRGIQLPEPELALSA